MLGAVFYTLALTLPANAREVTFTTIDVAGAAATSAAEINPGGMIVGEYLDSTSFAFHGFLRARDGTITTFDAPGAGTRFLQGTMAGAINPGGGAITGSYVDASNVTHSYLRTQDGTITEFDVTDAGTGESQGTGTGFGNSINPAGTITGTYTDSSDVNHAFSRAPDGTITTFDAPGAGRGSGEGTFVSGITGINQPGAIVGWYQDASGVYHAFLRAADGRITTFDAPGAGTGSGQGTFAEMSKPAGAIVGTIHDGNGARHGFLRTLDGTFTAEIDASGAGTGDGQGTFAFYINPKGAITGYYIDAKGAFHGFLRSPDATITSFDAPSAGTASGQGTFALTMNPAGAITGYYIDTSGAFHGFLRNP